MNTFNTLSEAKKPSEPIQNKADKSQDLAQVLSDQWNAQPENDENSLDLTLFTKNHNFNVSDMVYLEDVKTKLLQDHGFGNFKKVIDELPLDRPDLAEVISFVYARILNQNSKA